MSSNLKVNTILPSTGSNVAIGTAGGTVTIVGNIDIDINSGISTFNDIHISDKIVHDGDTNTAIRFPANDTVSIETSGSERFRVDSNGNIGVGIVPSSGARFWVASNENPFVGTRYNAGADGSVLFLQHSRSNTIGAGAALNDNDEIGTVQFRAFASDNSSIKNAAFVKAEVNGTTGSAGVPADLIFGTGTSSGNATERLRITSSGKLLIGTTTPGYNDLDDLTISTSGNTGITIRSGTSSLGVIGFADGTSGNAQYRGVIQYSHSGDYMQFNTADAERLRILSTGELGVNTTAPVEKLGISGNIRLVNPTGTTRRINAIPSGSYNTGTSGGSAICFQRFADGGGGSDEIFFETHWQGNRHGESMRINKYGHVTTPNQPSFNVTIGGGQINTNAGVIVFTDTTTLANHNTGNHYNTSNGRFTAPVAGRYQINARMLTNSSTTSYTIYLLRVNANHHGYIGHNHSDFWFMESGSWVLNLNANDYVDCYLQQHSGHGGFNYASFSGFLIG